MLRGTIDDFSLPDIFRLLSFTKKTGKLLVWRNAGDGKVFFRDGEVYFAQSSLKKEPLGQKLIRLGALTEGQLRKALDINATTGQRVGEVLLEQDAITEDQLIAAVKGQIEDACFDLLRWELGEFDFESHERFTVEIPISVSVENLIMEASRRLDELEMIRRRIPSADVVLAVAPAPPEGAREINIAPDEWRLLVLIDGQRSVGEICQVANLDEFTGLRTMYGLLSSGLVDVASMGPEPAPSPIAHPPVVSDEPVAPPEPPPAPPVDEGDHKVIRGPEGPPAPELDGPAVAVDLTSEDIAEEAPAEPPATPDYAVEYGAGEGGTVSYAETDESATEPEADDASAEDRPPHLDSPVAPEWRDESDPIPSLDAPVPPEWKGELDEAPSNGVAKDWTADLEAASASEEPAAGNEVPEDFLTDLVEDPVETPLDDLVEPALEADQDSVITVEDGAVEDAAASEPPPAPPKPNADDIASVVSPSVDRAAVVRELASLFSDDEQPRRTQASQEQEEEGVPEGHVKRRVEDDDEINKGLIGRFIDGVKGM